MLEATCTSMEGAWCKPVYSEHNYQRMHTIQNKTPLQHLTPNLLRKFQTRVTPQMISVVQDLKEKRVVEVPRVLDSGFISIMFLVKKQDGSMRPIFDLRGLNKHIATKHFPLVSQTDVADFLQENDWMVKLDTVRRLVRDCRFLRVYYNNQVLQLTALPFGLSSAPRTFVTVSNYIAEMLHARGIRLLVYLDDYLLVNQDRSRLQDQVSETISVLRSLGWHINQKKSVLVLTRELEYLGLMWNTKTV